MLKPKQKPLRDPKYLLALRDQLCVFTMRPETEASHIRRGTRSGTGQKPPDWAALPVHHDLHRELHNKGEITFYQKYLKDDAHIMMECVLAYAKLRYLKWLIERGRDNEVMGVLKNGNN